MIKFGELMSIKNKLSLQNCAYNKNVDINFNAHGVFLELSLSGTLKSEIVESQII
jgi:hypothetical protein